MAVSIKVCDLNWDAQNVPKRVKNWVKTQKNDFQDAFAEVLTKLHVGPKGEQVTGDGAYVLQFDDGSNHNVFHKRFYKSEYAVIYNYGARGDGKGKFLNVVGIAQHKTINGRSNAYAMVVDNRKEY